MASGSPGFRFLRLEDKTFGSNQSAQIQVAGLLPPGRMVHGVLFRLDIDITQPGAGQAAQLGAVLPQLISQIRVGRRVSVTGLGLHFLWGVMAGRVPNYAAGFPATASAVFSRGIEWYLPLADPAQHDAADCAVPSELFTDQIEVRFGSSSIFGATVPTLGNGTLRTFIVHGPSNRPPGRGVIPPSLNIQSDDFSSLQAVIQKPGLWTHAVLYREASNDAGAITNLNVASANTYVDGEQLAANLRASDFAAIYNTLLADGTQPKVESQTVPVGFETINSQPGPAAAAGQGVSVDVLPLVFPHKGYKLSDLPDARSGFRADFTGTLGSYKIAYRIVEPRPDSAIGKAAARLGSSGGRAVAVTRNGGPLTDPRMARYIPLDLA